MLPIAFLLGIASAPLDRSPMSTTCGQVQPSVDAQSSSTTSAVRLMQAWVHAINTGDDASFIRFVQNRGPVLFGNSEQWVDLRHMLRGLQFCGLKDADSQGVNLWVFDPNRDGFGVARFTPSATTADKFTLEGISATDGAPPRTSRPPRLSPSSLAEAVQARVAHDVADDDFSGAVLLAKRGRVFFQQAYGFADRANHVSNALDTQFRFGSMGKMFTAVAIMQLVQDGRLNLGAPVGRYLTDYRNRDVATKVTIANLLTHTGGTGDIFGPEFDAHKDRLRRLQDYVDLYGTRPPEFKPGSRMTYSNYGFILLGRIVEAVSGLSYDQFLRAHIFVPAGMMSTGNLPESTKLPRRAEAYTGYGAKLRRADDTLPLNGTSAGGGYSTVGDFNRFVAGLTSGRLLHKETLQKLIKGGVRLDNGRFTQFDFGGTMSGVGRYIGHEGGAPGQNGCLYYFPANGYTVVVLANRDPIAADAIATFAAHRLPLN